ncbi:MAG: transcriptional repressor LexA [Gammaproteobacteria bacterium]|jgi:repressor LexA|nr:transcriptional repressor LexA [Pseudomonadota bacterium]MDG2303005.1 transcriptional repressor LexA [Gammaproteobacteria bacterium]MBT5066056.1 transcriptional repressor LexA [Pseudomonadota bacterium]MBT6193825.1 transcriptional repressor LexA [Pseudomonadota bacterium]MBT6464715.1 transcriptional repressor LexA [Pseudomonadota bacterium]
MTLLLTKRQSEVLSIVRKLINTTGRPPTRIEISDQLGFRSANAAEEHLRAIARKGFIELIPGTSRGIRLIDNKMSINALPVVGRVAAGQPILAIENIEENYVIDPSVFHPRADYLLRVEGLSMKDVGILDGDLLAVKSTQDVSNGQIVVARINDEVTVKRFKRMGSVVSLLPENSDFEILKVDLREEELFIEGLGVGVVRLGI